MRRKKDEGDSKLKLEVAEVQRERKEETHLDSPRNREKKDKIKPRAKEHKTSVP